MTMRTSVMTTEARQLIAVALDEWNEANGLVRGVSNLIELMLSDQVAISVVVADDALKLC